MLPKDLPLLKMKPTHLEGAGYQKILSVLIPCVGQSYIALDAANSWPNEGPDLPTMLDSLGLTSEGQTTKLTDFRRKVDRDVILAHFVKVRYLLFKTASRFDYSWSKASSIQIRPASTTSLKQNWRSKSGVRVLSASTESVLRVVAWLECLEGLSIVLQMVENGSLTLKKVKRSSFQKYLNDLLISCRQKDLLPAMQKVVFERVEVIATQSSKRHNKLTKILKRNKTQDEFSKKRNGFNSGTDILSVLYNVGYNEFLKIITLLRKLAQNALESIEGIYKALASRSMSVVDRLIALIQNICGGIEQLINDSYNLVKRSISTGPPPVRLNIRKQMVEPLRFLLLAKTLYGFTSDKYDDSVANDVAQYAASKVQRAAVVSATIGVADILLVALNKILSIVAKILVIITPDVATAIRVVRAICIALRKLASGVTKLVLGGKGIIKTVKGSRGVNRYYYSALLATAMDYEKESKELGTVLFALYNMGDDRLLTIKPSKMVETLSQNIMKSSDEVPFIKGVAELHYRRLLLFQLFSSKAHNI